MKKPAIPAIVAKDDNVTRVLQALKENVELMNGMRQGVVTLVPTDATLADVIATLNIVIARLNVK